MPVGEMLARMSSRELSEWMAYDAVEPIGDYRADIRAGIVASTVANVYRAKGTPSLKATDFVMEFWEDADDDPEPQEPEVIAAKFDAIFGPG